MDFKFFANPRGEILPIGKNPHGESEKSPLGTISLWGFANLHQDFVLEYFLGHYKFQVKNYRIYSVWYILTDISHFRCVCQLKVLGYFPKTGLAKKSPVAVIYNLNLSILSSL